MFDKKFADAPPDMKKDDRRRVDRGIVGLAAALSFVLAAVAVVDQSGGRSLEAYSVSMYESHGAHVESAVIYGVVYAVAGLLIVLWLLSLLASWASRRWSLGVVILVTVLNASIVLAMLFVTEYGERVLPARWGAMAALPAAAGIVAIALLARRSGARSR